MFKHLDGSGHNRRERAIMTKRTRLKNHSSIADKLAFYSMPEPNSGCLLWIASSTLKGYGLLDVRGVGRLAHRHSYEQARGPIPLGMQVCHKCDVPSCINPDHLFLGTPRDNMQDSVKKNRSSRGERSGVSYLTEEEARGVFWARGFHKDIAEEFGLSRQHVGAIKRRVAWAHLDMGSPPH